MDTIHQEFIAEIKKLIPKGISTVDLLTDIIPMSKEAAYRRLRGDIPFSLDEVVRICRKMNISLDRLTEMKQDNNMFIFHLIPSFIDFSMEEYYQMLTWNMNTVDFLRSNPKSMVYSALNTLPYSFALKYCLLTRVKLFKWAYQMNPQLTVRKLSEIHIPEKIFTAQIKYLEKSQDIPTCILLDSLNLETFINDIHFFVMLDVISPQEVEEIKNELFLLINEMEEVAKFGEFSSGKKVQINISHTVFDATYIYAESENYKLATIYMYGINGISCNNTKICENQKFWIESLMRYSTLISGCGELERTLFFSKQQALINSL